MTISEFLRVLDSSKGVQGNKMLFVENCATHPQNMSFLSDVKVVHHPPNCKSMLLDQHKMFSRICT